MFDDISTNDRQNIQTGKKSLFVADLVNDINDVMLLAQQNETKRCEEQQKAKFDQLREQRRREKETQKAKKEAEERTKHFSSTKNKKKF